MHPVPTPSLEDRLAIQDLIARYAWALDTGDIDGVANCFTTDGVVIEEVFEDPDRWEGRDGVRALAEHYRTSAGFPGRQHHVSQSIVTGDSQRCAVKSFAFVTECRGEPPYTLRFTGYYDDQIVKIDGQWLFKERIIRLWDGAVLARFPGRGTFVPRKRPPELVIRSKRTLPARGEPHAANGRPREAAPRIDGEQAGPAQTGEPHAANGPPRLAEPRIDGEQAGPAQTEK